MCMERTGEHVQADAHVQTDAHEQADAHVQTDASRCPQRPEGSIGSPALELWQL